MPGARIHMRRLANAGRLQRGLIGGPGDVDAFIDGSKMNQQFLAKVMWSRFMRRLLNMSMVSTT